MPSLQHQLVAAVVARIRGSRDVTDEEALRAEMLAADATTSPPPARLVRGMEHTTLDGYGFPVHDLRVAGADPQRTLLYLHGGAFVGPADRAHWRYVVRAARLLDLRVVVPAYPLAPRHTWRDSRDGLLRLFDDLAVASPGGVVLGGDSAGGGLALALAQQIAAGSGPQPTHLVLVAPWVDLTDRTPGTLEAAARDPWLKLSRLRVFGRWWAGPDDVTRPEVSPLNGDLAGLPPGLMWCGTRDLLQPQCRLLANRAAAQGWDLRYVERPGLIHVYPILPVPEARVALTELVDFLGGPAGEPGRAPGPAFRSG